MIKSQNFFLHRIVFRIFKCIKLLQLTGKTLGKYEEIEQGYPEMGIEIEQFLFKCHQFSAIYVKSGNFEIDLVLNLKK